MVRFTIHYNSYPDCKEASDYSKQSAMGRFWLGLFAGIAALIFCGNMFTAAASLYKSHDLINFLIGLAAYFASILAFWAINFAMANSEEVNILRIRIRNIDSFNNMQMYKDVISEAEKNCKEKNKVTFLICAAGSIILLIAIMLISGIACLFF